MEILNQLPLVFPRNMTNRCKSRFAAKYGAKILYDLANNV